MPRTPPTVGNVLASAWAELALERQLALCDHPTFVGALTQVLAALTGQHPLTVRDGPRLMTGLLMPCAEADYYATIMLSEHVEAYWARLGETSKASGSVISERVVRLHDELARFDFGALTLDTAFDVVCANPQTAARADGRLIAALWWHQHLVEGLGAEGARTMLALRVAPDGILHP